MSEGVLNDGRPTGDDGTWQVICLAAAAVMYLNAGRPVMEALVQQAGMQQKKTESGWRREP